MVNTQKKLENQTLAEGLRNSFWKSDPLEQLIPVCLNMWVPPAYDTVVKIQHKNEMFQIIWDKCELGLGCGVGPTFCIPIPLKNTVKI